MLSRNLSRFLTRRLGAEPSPKPQPRPQSKLIYGRHARQGGHNNINGQRKPVFVLEGLYLDSYVQIPNAEPYPCLV
jgi:hypothetical protein